MEVEETVISDKLRELRGELEERLQDQRESDELWELSERYEGVPRNEVPRDIRNKLFGGDKPLRAMQAGPPLTGNDILRQQIGLLEELQGQIAAQRSESRVHFLAMQDTSARSSRQGFWLTIISSAVSLIFGWLLSLLTTPLGVLHAFGR